MANSQAPATRVALVTGAFARPSVRATAEAPRPARLRESPARRRGQRGRARRRGRGLPGPPARPDAGFGIVDLAEPGTAERMVETALARFSARIDVLVNNAGIRLPQAVRRLHPRGLWTAWWRSISPAAFFASQAVLAGDARPGRRPHHPCSRASSARSPAPARRSTASPRRR